MHAMAAIDFRNLLIRALYRMFKVGVHKMIGNLEQSIALSKRASTALSEFPEVTTSVAMIVRAEKGEFTVALPDVQQNT